MNKTKFVVRVAMCVALLIAGQLALSSVSGIEIVTVMLLCFCYCYGVRHGIAIAGMHGILRRSLELFPDILALLKDDE